MPENKEFKAAFEAWRKQKPWGGTLDAFQDLGDWAERDPEFVENLSSYLDAEDQRDLLSAAREKAGENTPNQKALKFAVANALPVAAMGPLGTSGASLAIAHKLGGGAKLAQTLGIGARAGAAALNSNALSARPTPDITSTENIAQLFGLGGRLATSNTALGRFPGIMGAAESILGTSTGRAINNEPPQPMDLVMPLLSGGAGWLFGRAGKALKEAPNMQESDFRKYAREAGTPPIRSSSPIPRAPDTILEDINKIVSEKAFSRIPERTQELLSQYRQTQNSPGRSELFKQELLGWFTQRGKVKDQLAAAKNLFTDDNVKDTFDKIFGTNKIEAAGGRLKPSELLTRFLDAREELIKLSEHKGVFQSTIGRVLFGDRASGMSLPIGDYILPLHPRSLVDKMGKNRGDGMIEAIEKTIEALKNPGTAARPSRDLVRALAKFIDKDLEPIPLQEIQAEEDYKEAQRLQGLAGPL